MQPRFSLFKARIDIAPNLNEKTMSEILYSNTDSGAYPTPKKVLQEPDKQPSPPIPAEATKTSVLSETIVKKFQNQIILPPISPNI